MNIKIISIINYYYNYCVVVIINFSIKFSHITLISRRGTGIARLDICSSIRYHIDTTKYRIYRYNIDILPIATITWVVMSCSDYGFAKDSSKH